MSHKHVREDDRLLAAARAADTLTAAERRLLAAVVATGPVVIHLQSGHGLDDLDLVRAGARSVVGVDYSSVAVGAARRRASALGLASRYVVGEAVRTPIRTGAADLVYTGKGALIWVTDLAAWAAGSSAPAGPCSSTRPIRPSRCGPGTTMPPGSGPTAATSPAPTSTDSFPAHGAIETQWTLGEIVTAITAAGLHVTTLEEYPEPFWRPGDVDAAAWRGQLPNAYALLARA